MNDSTKAETTAPKNYDTSLSFTNAKAIGKDKSRKMRAVTSFIDVADVIKEGSTILDEVVNDELLKPLALLSKEFNNGKSFTAFCSCDLTNGLHTTLIKMRKKNSKGNLQILSVMVNMVVSDSVHNFTIKFSNKVDYIELCKHLSTDSNYQFLVKGEQYNGGTKEEPDMRWSLTYVTSSQSIKIAKNALNNNDIAISIQLPETIEQATK